MVEAIRAAKPIIETSIGGIFENMHSDVGELCQAGHAEARERAVVRWLPDNDRRSDAGRSVRRFAEEYLCWWTIARQLTDFLSALIRCPG